MKKLLAAALALTLALTLAGPALAAEAEKDEPEAAKEPKAAPDKEQPDSGTVIWEDDDLAVTLISGETNDRGDYVWTLRLENRSRNALMVTMDRFVLNGISCEAAFGALVKARGKLETTNVWSAAALEAAGLDPEKIASASGRFSAFDVDHPDKDPCADQTVTLDLTGDGQAPAFKPGRKDIQVFDEDTAAMYITDFVPSPDTGEYIVKVMLVNKTDHALSVEMADGYVGPEHMTSGYMKQMVPPHAAGAGSWAWGYDWMAGAGYYGQDGLIRSDLPMALNINIYDEDDMTVDAVSLTDVPVEH